MRQTSSIHAFIGILSLAYDDRGEGFAALLDLIKDAAAMPLRAEKLEVLLTRADLLCLIASRFCSADATAMSLCSAVATSGYHKTGR
jgi:hypothetical protein